MARNSIKTNQSQLNGRPQHLRSQLGQLAVLSGILTPHKRSTSNGASDVWGCASPTFLQSHEMFDCTPPLVLTIIVRCWIVYLFDRNLKILKCKITRFDHIFYLPTGALLLFSYSLFRLLFQTALTSSPDVREQSRNSTASRSMMNTVQSFHRLSSLWDWNTAQHQVIIIREIFRSLTWRVWSNQAPEQWRSFRSKFSHTIFEENHCWYYHCFSS